MNWSRIVAASIWPIAVALPIAALAWRKRKPLLGNILGLGILFLSAITFASIEFGDAFYYRLWCQEVDAPCPPSDPSDFVRIATYGIVAFVQAGVLFWVGLKVEERMRRGEFDPSWRELRN
jgi:hypothetical protein